MAFDKAESLIQEFIHISYANAEQYIIIKLKYFTGKQTSIWFSMFLEAVITTQPTGQT